MKMKCAVYGFTLKTARGEWAGIKQPDGESAINIQCIQIWCILFQQKLFFWQPESLPVACQTWQQVMYAHWIPSIVVHSLKTGWWNTSSLGPQERTINFNNLGNRSTEHLDFTVCVWVFFEFYLKLNT